MVKAIEVRKAEILIRHPGAVEFLSLAAEGSVHFPIGRRPNNLLLTGATWHLNVNAIALIELGSGRCRI